MEIMLVNKMCELGRCGYVNNALIFKGECLHPDIKKHPYRGYGSEKYCKDIRSVDGRCPLEKKVI